MNVLIIPEDFRNDRYLLKPLFTRLFADLGKPRAEVTVCTDPVLGGIGEALKVDRLREIVAQYPMVHIFILCVDRDGEINRRRQLDRIEQAFLNVKPFLAENAREELETWILAALGPPKGWTWRRARSERDVKENCFALRAIELKYADGPTGGRKEMGIAAARNIPAIRRKCPEDFGHLANRLKSLLRTLP